MILFFFCVSFCDLCFASVSVVRLSIFCLSGLSNSFFYIFFSASFLSGLCYVSLCLLFLYHSFDHRIFETVFFLYFKAPNNVFVLAFSSVMVQFLRLFRGHRDAGWLIIVFLLSIIFTFLLFIIFLVIFFPVHVFFYVLDSIGQFQWTRPLLSRSFVYYLCWAWICKSTGLGPRWVISIETLEKDLELAQHMESHALWCIFYFMAVYWYF